MLDDLKKMFLPKEVNFMAMLLTHADEIEQTIAHLLDATDIEMQNSLLKQSEEQLRQENKALLESLITPYDREALYRIISQFIWLKMSIRHFHLEVDELQPSKEIATLLAPLITDLKALSEHLKRAIKLLDKKETELVNDAIVLLFNKYEQFIEHSIILHTTIMHFTDTQQLFICKELTSQLKEIAKRLRVCAMSVDDLLMKSY